MATTLLLNPRRRRAARKGAKRSRKSNPSAAQKRARAAFAAMARGRSRAARAANPKRRRARRSARRSNPIVSYRRSVSRRRRNPISLGGSGLTNLRSYIAPIKDAAVMGAGAVAMDLAYGYAQPYLPAMLQRQAGRVGLGDLTKALLTVAFGKLLAKPTRGLSQKAAMGALVVQMRDVVLAFIPPRQAVQAVTVNGVGAFANPARVVQGNSRTTGSAGYTGVGAYVPARSPLLSGFVSAPSPLLAGSQGSRRGAWSGR